MSEAKPNKKGAHTFGRRYGQMSNTAEEGELCIYTGHSLGRFSSHSMRYDSHQACTRCVAAAREGRMSLSLDTLLPKYKQKALKFWSQVDIRSPNECWNWEGCINTRTHQPQFSWRRPGISSSTQQHPQRVAMWLSWGDLGFAGVKTTCGNKYCCNPFHLIPQNVGVFVDDDTYLESFELACELHALTQSVQEYVIESMADEEMKDSPLLTPDQAQLLLDPNSSFDSKFEAVLTDMVNGSHITQISSPHRNIDTSISHEIEDEDPTDDY